MVANTKASTFVELKQMDVRYLKNKSPFIGFNTKRCYYKNKQA